MLIYLIGLPGVGKSTIGKKLANQLGIKFLDIDTEIERKLGLTITQIFENRGENFFRDIEKEELQNTFILKNYVIATGGGTPCFFNNLTEMKKHGKTFYLNASPEFILSRIKNNEKRPLLMGDDKLNRLKKLYQERKETYQNADFSLSVEKSKNIIHEITVLSKIN